ncbi:unnamed protein product [Protopolystoma xenopodis]|uniref:MIB/HERC2 domain-containing protein n=1 Tax=Protopolystoma xenopodis TaxID=117903 RepID=A0A3S5BTS0_9PLAT|nr:unnamed protein product [Protopolystoma xenopodis]
MARIASTGGVNDGDSGGSVVATGLIAVPTQGRVTERRNWYAWALHSAVSIVWDSGASNIYRLGYMGLVDLKDEP